MRRANLIAPRVYRNLVYRVGRQWHWVNVVRVDSDKIAARLAEPSRAVFRAYRGREILGFFELVRLEKGIVELEYLGLLPKVLGKGYGRTLLEAAIAEACALGAEKLVARTCTLDHPAAAPLYLAAGFRIVGYQRDVVVPLTRSEIDALTNS